MFDGGGAGEEPGVVPGTGTGCATFGKEIGTGYLNWRGKQQGRESFSGVMPIVTCDCRTES